MTDTNGGAELIMLLKTACHEHLYLCTELYSRSFQSLHLSLWMRQSESVAWKHKSMSWLSYWFKHLQAYLKLFFMRRSKLCCHMCSAGMTCTHISRQARTGVYCTYTENSTHMDSDTSVKHKSWLMWVEFERKGQSLWYLYICVSITRPPTQHYLYTVLQT